MNERFKELAKQAGGNPNYKAFRGHFLPPPPDYIDPATVDLNKFAELIVKECAKELREAEHEADRAYKAKEVKVRNTFDGYDFAVILEERFGVE